MRQLQRNEPGTGINQLSIVSVSHAWETSVHPDPRGANLLLLVDAIKRAQTTPEKDAGGSEAKLLPLLLGGILRLLLSFQRDPTLFEASETPEAKEEGEERDAFIAALKAKTAFYGGEAYDKSRSEAEGRPSKPPSTIWRCGTRTLGRRSSCSPRRQRARARCLTSPQRVADL